MTPAEAGRILGELHAALSARPRDPGLNVARVRAEEARVWDPASVRRAVDACAAVGIRVHIDQPAPALTKRSRPVLPVALDVWAQVPADAPLTVRQLRALAQWEGVTAADLRERVRIGRARYGIELHTHTGHDNDRDLCEELPDAYLYAVARWMESGR